MKPEAWLTLVWALECLLPFAGFYPQYTYLNLNALVYTSPNMHPTGVSGI